MERVEADAPLLRPVRPAGVLGVVESYLPEHTVGAEAVRAELARRLAAQIGSEATAPYMLAGWRGSCGELLLEIEADQRGEDESKMLAAVLEEVRRATRRACSACNTTGSPASCSRGVLARRSSPFGDSFRSRRFSPCPEA